MSQQADEIKRYHEYLERIALERAGRPDERFARVEPCRPIKSLPFKATPSNYAAALRIGCGEDWINEMQARYGGDW